MVWDLTPHLTGLTLCRLALVKALTRKAEKRLVGRSSPLSQKCTRHMTTGNSVENIVIPYKRAYALASYALAYVALTVLQSHCYNSCSYSCRWACRFNLDVTRSCPAAPLNIHVGVFLFVILVGFQRVAARHLGTQGEPSLAVHRWCLWLAIWRSSMACFIDPDSSRRDVHVLPILASW